MKKLLFFSIISFVLFIGHNAKAMEEMVAINNVAHDYASCATFYTFVIMRAEIDHLPQNIIDAAKMGAENAINMSNRLTSQEVTIARINMTLTEFKAIIDRNPMGSTSVILEKYAMKCKKITEDPVSVYEEYLKK